MNRKVIILALLVSIFLASGWNVISVPQHELACSSSVLQKVCAANSPCISPYLLKIGNSGTSLINAVSVTLPEEWPERLALEPKMHRFGKIIQSYSRPSAQVINFGPLESDKWVELSLILESAPSESLIIPQCKSLVHSEEAPVIQGSPELLRFGRFWYAILAPLL